eukprot:1223671-Amphidinium_carterae.2
MLSPRLLQAMAVAAQLGQQDSTAKLAGHTDLGKSPAPPVLHKLGTVSIPNRLNPHYVASGNGAFTEDFKILVKSRAINGKRKLLMVG